MMSFLGPVLLCYHGKTVFFHVVSPKEQELFMIDCRINNPIKIFQKNTIQSL